MLLTMKENKRLQIMQEILAKIRTVTEAAAALDITERQTFRVLADVRENGALGVIHGNRGREPWNKTPDEIRVKVVKMRREEYEDFNDRHFRDDLEDEGIMKLGRETVRKILRSSGIEPVKAVKKRVHRSRRKPMERFGEMLQGDGSYHDWLESRGPWLMLVHFVDDATNYEWADFFEGETTEAYFRVVMGILKTHGLPRCLYVDHHGVFSVNRQDTLEEQLSGIKPVTTFERAMQELAVSVILANSPQAKGRVERRGGFNQDRLVSELRKANACTIEEARVVLKKYLKKINKRFARKPANSESAFTPFPESCDLKQILCWKEERTVNNDNTISFKSKAYQIQPSLYRSSWAKCKVAVHLCLDGSLHVFHKGQRIAYFKKIGVKWDDLPNAPLNTKALYTHTPTLTFSRGH